MLQHAGRWGIALNRHRLCGLADGTIEQCVECRDAGALEPCAGDPLAMFVDGNAGNFCELVDRGHAVAFRQLPDADLASRPAAWIAALAWPPP